MTNFQNDIRMRIERGAHKHGLSQLEACVQVAGVLTALIEAAPDAELMASPTSSGEVSLGTLP